MWSNQFVLVGAVFTFSVPTEAVQTAFLENAVNPNCSCLQWKGVYEYKLVNCGEGNEFYFETGETGGSEASINTRMNFNRALHKYGPEVCNRFFQAYNGNACMNIGHSYVEGSWDMAQWCFVPRKCKELAGGAQLAQRNGVRLRWKACNSSKGDELLRSHDPYNLTRIAVGSNLDLEQLVTWSYPAWDGEFWDDVRPFFENTRDGKRQMDKQLKKMLKRIVATNTPMIFHRDETKQPPFWILHNGSIYELFPGLAIQEHNRSTWHDLSCILHCPNNSKLSERRFYSKEANAGVRTYRTEKPPVMPKIRDDGVVTEEEEAENEAEAEEEQERQEREERDKNKDDEEGGALALGRSPQQKMSKRQKELLKMEEDDFSDLDEVLPEELSQRKIAYVSDID